jgi:hypothetical protein
MPLCGRAIDSITDIARHHAHRADQPQRCRGAVLEKLRRASSIDGQARRLLQIWEGVPVGDSCPGTASSCAEEMT